jgi:glycosyltransferase involved in cell wall biosynthesis
MVVVVLPAYNASRTLADAYREIPLSVVDKVILVDDASNDQTVSVARELGIETHLHQSNRGYGGNQKTCYKKALELGADIIIMLHPDYQYTPKLIPAMIDLIRSGEYDVVLGSRILGGKAIQGGMPRYKYYANRLLTMIQNILMGQKLSEYHTGYRAFSRVVLQRVGWQSNSDDFVFDNQMLCQILFHGFRVAEVTCPTKYFKEASSINFFRSLGYGAGCLKTALLYRLNKWNIIRSDLFKCCQN